MAKIGLKIQCSMCGIDKPPSEFRDKGKYKAQPCMICGSLLASIKKSYTGDTDKRKLAAAASRQRYHYQMTGQGGYPKPVHVKC